MIEDPSLQAVIDALTMYQNNLDTLQSVVQAAEAYLGENWISMLPNVLEKADLESSKKDLLKERADHAIHYYGATAAYTEIQEYLKNPEAIDKAQVTARLPILDYWMEFFGPEGKDLVNSLKIKLEPDEVAPTPQWDAQMEKLQQEVAADQSGQETSATNDQVVDESELIDTTQVAPANDVAQAFENILRPEEEPEEKEVPEEETAETEVTSEEVASAPEQPAEKEPVEEQPVSSQTEESSSPVAEETPAVEEAPVAEPEVEPIPKEGELEPIETPVPAEDEVSLAEDSNFPKTIEEAKAQTQTAPVQRENSQKDWTVENFVREWKLYEDVFSWLNARCLRLKLTDKKGYPYYGFLVDLMRSLRDDAQALLDNTKYDAILPVEVNGGREAVEGLKAALDKEILDLTDEYPTSVEEQLNPKEIENVFGPIDNGPDEDVGPAPDGFVLMDDPFDTSKKPDVITEETETGDKKQE